MSRFKNAFFLSVMVGLTSLTSALAQTTVAPTYPPLTGFLWGNTSVNAVGQTSFVNGTGLGYRYLLPKNFNPNTKYPAIIYLHGSGEVGTDNNAQLAASNNSAHGALALVSTANPDNQTNFPCFFIAPQTTTAEGWSSDQAAADIQNLLAIFETQYPKSFDTTRIYLTGASMGGDGVYQLPYLLSQSNFLGANPFAALAPMSGNLWGRDVSTEPQVPLWAFHGVLDTNVPINTSDDVTVPEMRADGYSVIYSRYANGAHDIWEVAFQHPQLLPWLFSQHLGGADAPFANFTVTGATQSSGGAYATLSGTASSAGNFNGISWNNYTSGQTGTGPTSLAPTWSLPSIPLVTGNNYLDAIAQAPNNAAVAFGVYTDYGGTLTVNVPYSVMPTADGSSDIALNKPVTVSSEESTSLAGSNAVDGNNTTRWSSVYSDPQWIVVDLGSNFNISEVDLNWETACGKDYLIQTSTDNVNWTTQFTVTGNATAGLHTYPVPSATLPVARYIRMYGTARATAWGYSLYEISVYGTPATTTPPTSPSTDLALNKTVTVSSIDSADHAGSMAVDGDDTTRWSSEYSDPQWLVVDLGGNYTVGEVDLNWETACGKNYLIQTSTDDVNWTTQFTVTGNTTPGLHTYPITSAKLPTARYVRMYGTARATGWGYSLYEISVYGTANPSKATTPSATKLSLDQPVTVSSVDFAGNAGSNAVDNDLTTRWSSSYSDPQWIVVDLGANHTITEVDLDWETACGKNYLIQTSTDDVNWTTQTTVTGNTTAGLHTYTYSTPPTARYVRMYGTARATAWGYSLYDFSVYGQ